MSDWQQKRRILNVSCWVFWAPWDGGEYVCLACHTNILGDCEWGSERAKENARKQKRLLLFIWRWEFCAQPNIHRRCVDIYICMCYCQSDRSRALNTCTQQKKKEKLHVNAKEKERIAYSTLCAAFAKKITKQTSLDISLNWRHPDETNQTQQPPRFTGEEGEESWLEDTINLSHHIYNTRKRVKRNEINWENIFAFSWISMCMCTV